MLKFFERGPRLHAERDNTMMRPWFHHIRFWNALRKRVGTRSTVYWLLLRVRRKLGAKERETWYVRPPQARYPLMARLCGSSDMESFRQIFIDDEYARLRELNNVKFVLDLGANVGFSSAYFLTCFPESHVVAVEPDERNLKICRGNLDRFGARAIALHGAVWSRCTQLEISQGTFGDRREWATQVFEPNEGVGTIKAWDVGTLIDMAGEDEVGLLKIDIERAELAVFGDKASVRDWLPRVRNLCIELHGEDCREVFFRALADFDYELQRSGELTICRNLRLGSGKVS
jgi:FkbM family methyltransferase